MKLPMGAAEGISNSKRLYVIERIKTLEDSQLISLDKKRPEELSKVWPGKTLPNDADWHDSTYLNSRYLEQCGMLECSRSNFTALLEAIVHPECREGEEQLQLVETLNRHLRPDNYELQHVSNLSGRPVYKVRPARGGVGGSPKNIIFAADGPKPELVFKDAINNDIEIVENAEFCLVYNWPLDEDGLSWRKLASWWQEQQNEPDEASARKSLGARLFKSLDNPAEQKVFSVYYKHFASLNPDLPALIPHFCCTSSTSLRVQVLSGFEPTGSRSVAASGLLRKKGKCIADRRLQTPVLVGNSGPCRVWLCENNRPRRIEAR